LQAAFKTKRGSSAAFDALSESMRRRLLAYLGDAKTPATRVKRIAKIFEIAAAGRAATAERG
jgi:uncharacterized protein YdeI (YjbR/CyaY-like superfamily)